MPTEIKFSPGGDRFSLLSLQNIDVWTISKAGLEKRLTCNSKPSTVQWTDNDRLFVGLDNGNIIKFTVSETQATTIQAHKQRVKCMHFENNTLYTASSMGQVKAWSMDENSMLKEICSTNASCRVTCIALNRQSHLIKKEEQSDVENDNQNGSDKNESDVSDTDTKALKSSLKRKPGAFVTISYDDNKDNEDNEAPPAKKTKRRKRNKKKNMKGE